MSYFNTAQEIKAIANASPVRGLLAQDGKVISYASRALSDMENRYAKNQEGNASDPVGSGTFSSLPLQI